MSSPLKIGSILSRPVRSSIRCTMRRAHARAERVQDQVAVSVGSAVRTLDRQSSMLRADNGHAKPRARSGPRSATAVQGAPSGTGLRTQMASWCGSVMGRSPHHIAYRSTALQTKYHAIRRAVNHPRVGCARQLTALTVAGPSVLNFDRRKLLDGQRTALRWDGAAGCGRAHAEAA